MVVPRRVALNARLGHQPKILGLVAYDRNADVGEVLCQCGVTGGIHGPGQVPCHIDLPPDVAPRWDRTWRRHS